MRGMLNNCLLPVIIALIVFTVHMVAGVLLTGLVFGQWKQNLSHHLLLHRVQWWLRSIPTESSSVVLHMMVLVMLSTKGMVYSLYTSMVVYI